MDSRSNNGGGNCYTLNNELDHPLNDCLEVFSNISQPILWGCHDQRGHTFDWETPTHSLQRSYHIILTIYKLNLGKVFLHYQSSMGFLQTLNFYNPNNQTAFLLALFAGFLLIFLYLKLSQPCWRLPPGPRGVP